MKKLGFTLAEILVSLAIIGVIAALTLPTLNTSTQKKQIGPALAKAVNTLENANRHIMQETGTDDLQSAMKVFLNSTSKYYTELLSTIVSGGLSGAGGIFTTKDGIEFKCLDANKALKDTTKNGGLPKYAYKYYIVEIDINGPNTKPNLEGQDIFRVWVDNKGSVVPYGGSEYGVYNNNDSSFVNTCGTGEGQSIGIGCTGRIADDGWKVTY